MKRYIKSKSDLTHSKNIPYDESQSNNTDHDFDERWDNKFGEPSTEVFEPDDFQRWMQEVIDFE